MKGYFIWGMGLLGTSLALDLKRLGYPVGGMVRTAEEKNVLQKLGFSDVFLSSVLEKTASGKSSQDAFWQYVRSCEGIILGTPVDSVYGILEILQRELDDHSIWITDMASTKGDLMKWVDALPGVLNFAGSHPMAGSDLSGPSHGREKLFEAATIYLTPSNSMSQKLTPAKYNQTLHQIEQFWIRVGARPYQISHLVDDKWGAYLSHGLHMVSCMVSHLLKDIPEVFEMPNPPSGGSFRDITRVAGSNPDLWDGIISSNAGEVTKYLISLESLVRDWRQKLEKGELPIREIFIESARIRNNIIKNNNHNSQPGNGTNGESKT